MSLQTSMQLSDIPNCHLDDTGIFKYIQIKVTSIQNPESSKIIIRGFEECEYHADIYDRVAPFLNGAGYQTNCLGGGRIKRSEGEIFVYGYSVGFGKGDHQVACDIIKEFYGGDLYVHWSDEGEFPKKYCDKKEKTSKMPINRIKSPTNDYSNTILLICDIQQKFKPVMKNYETTVNIASRLINVAARFKIDCLITEQYPRGLGKTDEVIREQLEVFDKNASTSAAESSGESSTPKESTTVTQATTKPTLNYKILEKTIFSMVTPDPISKNFLQNKQKCIILGFETHVCILQTCYDLIEQGKTVFLVLDAVESRSLLDKSTAVKRLEKIGVEIVTHESLIFELVGGKEGENFKFCSALVRDLLH